MKVLIDTNVLYSAFIMESVRMVRLIEWVLVYHEAVITPYIADEILEKSSLKAPETLEVVTTFLASNNLRFVDLNQTTNHPRYTIRDKDDQTILNAALDNEINVIITGDKDFHALEIEHPRIMWPADFTAEFLPESK